MAKSDGIHQADTGHSYNYGGICFCQYQYFFCHSNESDFVSFIFL